MANVPDFHDLPEVPGQPQGNAWGLWGPDDQLGSMCNHFLNPGPKQRSLIL